MLLVCVLLLQTTLALSDGATSTTDRSCHVRRYYHRSPLINIHIEIAIGPLLRPVFAEHLIARVFLHLFCRRF